MYNMLGLWSPGPLELVVLLIIAVLLFGKRLPEIARGMGNSVMEFKRGLKEVKDTNDEIKKEINEKTE